MTITTLAASAPNTNDADLAVLSVSRLLARLEHNLLAPGADLVELRKSEFQRMRVGANIEYARSNLSSLERNIPTTKPLDRRHSLQTEVQRHRETLKRLQALLEGIDAEAQGRAAASTGQGVDDDDGESVDGEDLLGTPEESGTENELGREEDEDDKEEEQEQEGKEKSGDEDTKTKIPATATNTNTTTTAPVPTTTTSPTLTPTATLRNRHTTSPSSPSNAQTTGSDHLPPSTTSPSPSASTSNAQDTEQTLSTHRAEQEDLTSSLLSLASQLKSSSQAFQTSLDSEKSVLARAVDGLDRTTGNMQAAERRMGMLRRMTEGKGWWGRMMLYAWILGLWVVAVLIVFLGPKLRF